MRAVEGEEEGELGVREGNEGEGYREPVEEGVGICWLSFVSAGSIARESTHPLARLPPRIML